MKQGLTHGIMAYINESVYLAVFYYWVVSTSVLVIPRQKNFITYLLSWTILAPFKVSSLLLDLTILGLQAELGMQHINPKYAVNFDYRLILPPDLSFLQTNYVGC